MKIGILTLPLHTNYGGILQAYALQTVLERMGHEVIVLDKPFPPYRRPSYIVFMKRIILKILGRKIMIFPEKILKHKYPLLSIRIKPFLNKHLHQYRYSDYCDIPENSLGAIVVGSDQVWRKAYYSNIEEAFLSFATGWSKLKRISYAASFGLDYLEYSESEKKKCKKLLSRFDFVSVRESSGVDICKKIFGVNAKLVLDPTLLLSSEDYEHLLDLNNEQNNEAFLMHYVLNHNSLCDELISSIASKMKISINNFDDIRFVPGIKDEDLIKRSVEEWIIGFRDASFIVTDSFHACIFSLIFNKPFAVVGNYGRGFSRFDNLLRMFKQEYRLIGTMDDFNRNYHLLIKNPDVKDMINLKAEESLNFLLSSLQ